MSNIYDFWLCMKYDICRRCPRNKICETEYQRQLKKKAATKAKDENENGNKNLG